MAPSHPSAPPRSSSISMSSSSHRSSASGSAAHRGGGRGPRPSEEIHLATVRSNVEEHHRSRTSSYATHPCLIEDNIIPFPTTGYARNSTLSQDLIIDADLGSSFPEEHYLEPLALASTLSFVPQHDKDRDDISTLPTSSPPKLTAGARTRTILLSGSEHSFPLPEAEHHQHQHGDTPIFEGCWTRQDHTSSTSPRSSFTGDAEHKKLLRRVLIKTDLALLPLMGCITLLQFLDKAILSYAALLGLQKDLNLTGNDYSWAASIYYFGLVTGLVLWTLLLQRYTIDLIIGSAVTSWGIICMLHAATQNYSQILPIRFLLGFFESAITPAFILAVGQFYTKKETISRTAFWYGFNGLALIIGGSMSYGLSMASHQHPAPRMAVWRQLYIILGALTVLFGLLALAFLPSSPGKTRLYTANEREIAASRVTNRSSGRRGAAKTIFDRRIWTQSFEALRDPRLYIIFAGLFCGSIANGGVTAYSTQLLAGFGFRIDQTLLLTLAPGGAQIISVLLFVGVSLMARSRAIGGIVLLVVAVIGSILMLAQDLGRTGHVVGYCLLNMGSPAAVALYSFNSAAVAGHGKKVIFAASSQLAYATGNIIGPLTFRTSEKPNFQTAKKVIVFCLCGASFCLLLVLLVHRLWNGRRDRGIETRGSCLPLRTRRGDAEGGRIRFGEEIEGGQRFKYLEGIHTQQRFSTIQEGHELTDFKDQTFRYVL